MESSHVIERVESKIFKTGACGNKGREMILQKCVTVLEVTDNNKIIEKKNYSINYCEKEDCNVVFWIYTVRKITLFSYCKHHKSRKGQRQYISSETRDNKGRIWKPFAPKPERRDFEPCLRCKKDEAQQSVEQNEEAHLQCSLTKEEREALKKAETDVKHFLKELLEDPNPPTQIEEKKTIKGRSLLDALEEQLDSENISDSNSDTEQEPSDDSDCIVPIKIPRMAWSPDPQSTPSLFSCDPSSTTMFL